MKKIFGIFALLAAAVAFVSCENQQPTEEKVPIVNYDGPVDLVDQGFGMYYGDRYYNSVGIYYVVLSDAVCCRDDYGDPYLDSEGEMLVLEFQIDMEDKEGSPIIPEGTYEVAATKSTSHSINIENSYIKKMVGNIQYHYSLESGKINVSMNDAGGYDIMTEDLKIKRGKEISDAEYYFTGDIKLEQWSKVAADIQGINSDIVDMPFTDVSAGYYGNLLGYGTGNYVIQFATDGFMEDTTNSVPGILLVFNMFGKLVNTDSVILLEEGLYTVYPSFNYEVFSMLYGMDMSGTPFGTYVAQIDKNGSQSLEYITNGTVEVKRESENYEDVYTFTYDLISTTRRIKGVWRGALEFGNYAEESSRIVLSTLSEDVECDMSKVERGYLSHAETLVTTSMSPVDIAEAWTLNLEPRMWTAEEKKLPWEERIEVWDPNGDIMSLEFILPLESGGDIAPELNKEYNYTIQPNLSMDNVLYEVSVSKMGRPYDDIFYQPNWADKYTYMTGWDARRGFTFDGGFRGNWYMHYIPGTWQNMDHHAPVVKGNIIVKRTSEYVMGTSGREAQFEITWNLFDDNEVPYKIDGAWSGPISIRGSEL